MERLMILMESPYSRQRLAMEKSQLKVKIGKIREQQ